MKFEKVLIRETQETTARREQPSSSSINSERSKHPNASELPNKILN